MRDLGGILDLVYRFRRRIDILILALGRVSVGLVCL
jgi:hypothetical protein